MTSYKIMLRCRKPINRMYILCSGVEICEGSDAGAASARIVAALAQVGILTADVVVTDELERVPMRTKSRLAAAYVVPSTIVPDVPLKAHRAWLVRPAPGGIPHKDGERGRFLPDYGREGLRQEFGLRWLGSYCDACLSIKPLRA
jgi:hypothetical protein